MAVTEKVIFAEDSATVHVLIGEPQTLEDGTLHEPHESRVLKPGETLSLSEVPTYLRELVKEGKAPGLTLLTQNQANKLVEKAKRIKSIKITDFIDEDEEE